MASSVDAAAPLFRPGFTTTNRLLAAVFDARCSIKFRQVQTLKTTTTTSTNKVAFSLSGLECFFMLVPNDDRRDNRSLPGILRPDNLQLSPAGRVKNPVRRLSRPSFVIVF